MKQILIDKFTGSIERNFLIVKHYYEINLSEMVELTALRNEILNCLLLELFQASIFSTNHFLERLVKVALIKNYTIGFNYSQAEDYNKKIEESKNLYDSLVLHESLKKAHEECLITTDELNQLTGLRKKMRNPYSHAEISKINESNSKIFTGFMFSIEDVKEKLVKNEPLIVPDPTHINTFSPTFAQLQQEENARLSAFNYFQEVHIILLEIEKKLNKKRQSIS